MPLQIRLIVGLIFLSCVSLVIVTPSKNIIQHSF